MYLIYQLSIMSPSTSPLSLHDALPIWLRKCGGARRLAAEEHPFHEIERHHPERAEKRGDEGAPRPREVAPVPREQEHEDRKSTRLNSSHLVISYAVFCLKKKKNSHKSI